MGMWSLMGNEACSKCLEPHPCTNSIPAASFLPEIWDGFLAALSVPTLPICDPCYMTVATFYLQWQLKRGPCSTAALFSCRGSRHGCREGRDWACASWYFRAGQGYSHSIPRLVTMVNIQQVIWLLTHPHPYTECIPVQSEQSFWSHQSTRNTRSLVINLLFLKTVIRSRLLINMTFFIILKKAIYFKPRKQIIVVCTLDLYRATCFTLSIYLKFIIMSTIIIVLF